MGLAARCVAAAPNAEALRFVKVSSAAIMIRTGKRGIWLK
jgi:hypothetical protein